MQVLSASAMFTRTYAVYSRTRNNEETELPSEEESPEKTSAAPKVKDADTYQHYGTGETLSSLYSESFNFSYTRSMELYAKTVNGEGMRGSLYVGTDINISMYSVSHSVARNQENLFAAFRSIQISAPIFTWTGEDISVNQGDSDIYERYFGRNAYWGAEKTSDRLMDFIKAIAGDDPEKIESARKGALRGYKSVQSQLGSMPQVCEDTLDCLMGKIDGYLGGLGYSAEG